MEDTHGVIANGGNQLDGFSGLNPYYNGRYSWRRPILRTLTCGTLSLNPYYNGRYSWRASWPTTLVPTNRLNPYYNGRYSWRTGREPGNGKVFCPVLILIIMEDTHGERMLR